jgi:hypothetical protein
LPCPRFRSAWEVDEYAIVVKPTSESALAYGAIVGQKPTMEGEKGIGSGAGSGFGAGSGIQSDGQPFESMPNTGEIAEHIAGSERAIAKTTIASRTMAMALWDFFILQTGSF